MPRATPNELATDFWQPPLYPKQLEVYNCYHRYVLVSGPRLSGKTVGTLFRIVRHAWEVDHARVAMFARTVKVAKAAGAWATLIDSVIPAWIEAGVESPHAKFEYTLDPQSDGDTRMNRLRIRNYWGGETEIQLHSLKNDSDVEDKLLSSSFSLIYFSELQEFEDPAIFNVSMAQLRLMGVPFDQHMWIADTNPPESGPNHFAYGLWFKDKDMPKHPMPQEQARFKLIDFKITDNWCPETQEVILGLKNVYRDDPEGWQRFIEGKWTRSVGHSGKHFSLVFKKNVHVKGEASEDQEPEEMETLLPSAECEELFGGWDIGRGVNNSFHIVERTFNAEGKSVWWVLDELVWIADRVSVEDFGIDAIEKIDSIEKFIGHPVEWTHWSDTSAFAFNSHGTDELDAAVIWRLSEGRVIFKWAAKAKARGTVQKRVEYLRKLLRENRLFISAHCFETIKMFQNLRRGMGTDKRYYQKFYIAKGDEHKHAFDSLSYIIYSEMLEDLEETPNSTPNTGRRLISVPL